MQHNYTEKQKKFLSEHVIGCSYLELTQLFNQEFGTDLKLTTISATIKRLGLKNGRDCRIKPGNVPQNKGTKGLTGANKTSFKKGNRPPNWVPIGSERITKDGYIQVKIQEGKFQHNWRGKHILIWEEHNGSVPKGHKIIFGDGDKRNFDINNLILVTNAQMARLNQYDLIQNDADLTRTALVIVDLKSKISEKSKRR